MKYAAAALVFVLLAGATARAGDARPIVVELYTSQGCADCPPADALLGKLAVRQGLIALSLPINYWDMLGWKDTLASEANTRRQKAYAGAMGRGGVYTPQIIVDGSRDVVGSRTDAVMEAITAAAQARDEALEEAEDFDKSEIALPGALTSVAAVTHRRTPDGAWSIGVDLKRTPQQLRVALGRAPESVRRIDAVVWLFRIRSSAVVRIGAGENAGRTATYRNVVSEIRDLGHWRGAAMSIDVPRPDAGTPPHDSLAVIVQQGGYGRVLGAAFLGQATYYAQE